MGGRQPRPPPPQPSLAPPAPRAHRAPGPGRPAHPTPQPRLPRASFPHLLSGSPWPGTRSVGPETASKNRAARRTEVGHANTVPASTALLHRRLSLNLSLSLDRRRPARPRPTGSAPSPRARPRHAAVARVKGRPAGGREPGAPCACALPRDRMGWRVSCAGWEGQKPRSTRPLVPWVP